MATMTDNERRSALFIAALVRAIADAMGQLHPDTREVMGMWYGPQRTRNLADRIEKSIKEEK